MVEYKKELIEAMFQLNHVGCVIYKYRNFNLEQQHEDQIVLEYISDQIADLTDQLQDFLSEK